MAQITNKGRRWIQHGDNYIVLINPSITNFQITSTIHLPALATGDVTTRGPQHSSPTPPIAPRFSAGSMLSITTRPNTETVNGNISYMAHVRFNGGFGFTNGGHVFGGPALPTTERYDDVAQTWTARVDGLSRLALSGYSLNGYGYENGGASVSRLTSVTRFDDVLNTHVLRDSLSQARDFLGSYTINGFGFTSCGDADIGGFSTVVGTTEKLDESTDTQILRTSATARTQITCYGINNFGFTCGGQTPIIGPAVGTVERFDDTANTQTAVTSITARRLMSGFALNGFGFTSCGNNGGLSGAITKYDNISNAVSIVGVSFTAKEQAAGFSLNGFGFTAGGFIFIETALTERYDDVAVSVKTPLAAMNTARGTITGFATNEYFVNYDTMEP